MATMSSVRTSRILDLPSEILEQVILELDPLHIASLSQTCTDFATFIYYDQGSQYLWRNLYLTQLLDDPKSSLTRLGFPYYDSQHSAARIDWMRRLQRIIRARTVIRNPDLFRETERCTIMKTLLELVRNTPTSIISSNSADDRISSNLGWLAGTLRSGTLLDSFASHISTPNAIFVPVIPTQPLFEERQLLGELRTHFGLTRADFKARNRAESRGIVYAMRNFRASNDYGPYLRDGSGRVDWELMDGIHHVMSMHIVPAPGIDEEESESGNFSDTYTIYPMSLPFCQSEIPLGTDLSEVEDWAGISGSWECSFCFVDHRWLILYNNFNLSDNDPLQTALLFDPNFQEAYRAIHVQIRVTSVEEDVAHPGRPKIHFDGQVEGQARMIGWVAVTPDDCVRWHFSSGEPENPLWSSEGVQVGGVWSPFGVLGIWTTVQHDRNDPVGPFWLRRLVSEPPNAEG